MAEGNKPSASRRREYDLLETGKETRSEESCQAAAAKPVKRRRKSRANPPVSPASPALWIFPDDSDDETAEPAKIPKTHQTKSAPDATALAGEVRRAMKLLQSGKAVRAYQTLEKAPAGRRGVMPCAVPACLSGQHGQ